MRIGPKVFAIAVAAAFLTVAAASPGLASGYGGHHGGGHHYGQKHHGGGHYGHKRHHYGLLLLPFAYLFGYALGAHRSHHSYPRHNYGGHHRYGGNTYGGHRHGGHSYGRKSYGHHSSGYKSAPRACHRVTKIAYDDYGRRAKFGGTMCYDAYGAAYILPGSRHVIHYYH